MLIRLLLVALVCWALVTLTPELVALGKEVIAVALRHIAVSVH